MNRRAPPLVAIALLLPPLLYVGSYFAAVVPGGYHPLRCQGPSKLGVCTPCWTEYYRWEVRWLAPAYGPLEQLDRELRPAAWARDPDIRRVPL